MKTGRPVETPEARFYKTGKPFASLQNPNGAHTWHPMSFSPQTGLVYIPIHKQNYTFAHDAAFTPSPLTTNLGIRRAAAATDPAAGAAALQATLASVGGPLIAWDPVRQREVWRAEREGAANGGVLSTAGGLVFQGTGMGEFAALDARSGMRLWSTADTDRGDRAADLVQGGQPPICRDHGRHRRVVGDVWFADECERELPAEYVPSSRLCARGCSPASCGSSATDADARAAASDRCGGHGRARRGRVPDVLRQMSRTGHGELRHSSGPALQRGAPIRRSGGPPSSSTAR